MHRRLRCGILAIAAPDLSPLGTQRPIIGKNGEWLQEPIKPVAMGISPLGLYSPTLEFGHCHERYDGNMVDKIGVVECGDGMSVST